jgi:hypothetical protein
MKSSLLLISALIPLLAHNALASTTPRIEIWHGEHQQVGHLGSAQPDFNVLGHISEFTQVEQLFWSLNGRGGSPMHFHAFRRLVEDGDFNADIPIARMTSGENTVTITATLRDGQQISNSINVVKKSGQSELPMSIDWSAINAPQAAGQYVDGKWRLTENGLRTDRIGYDRVFLIGDQDWQDYDIRTSVTIHAVDRETTPISGGAGLGLIWRFAGHAVGGHRHFPSAQPKWGYQPFGAIGWLRWPKRHDGSPYLQFYEGGSDKTTNYGEFSYELEQPYALRLRCQTLPDADNGSGVTRYSFKIWVEGEREPQGWTWSHVQTDQHALRKGGFTLLAHHVDATFGNIEIREIK